MDSHSPRARPPGGRVASLRPTQGVADGSSVPGSNLGASSNFGIGDSSALWKRETC